MTKEATKHMNIAVLQTGRSVDALRAGHGDYDMMCKALLFRAPDEATTFAVLDGEFPETIEPYDAIIITGSRHGVYEDHPWIAPLEALIQDAYERKIKLIGVCFGHQIIAQALGGVVEKSDKGFGVGAMDYELITAEGDTREISLYAWHQDQVTVPPAGAKIIARSDFCEIAGLLYGDRAISFQAHPEFSRDYMESLAEERRGGVISDEMTDDAIASLEKKVEAEVIQEMLTAFLLDKNAE